MQKMIQKNKTQTKVNARSECNARHNHFVSRTPVADGPQFVFRIRMNTTKRTHRTVMERQQTDATRYLPLILCSILRRTSDARSWPVERVRRHLSIERVREHQKQQISMVRLSAICCFDPTHSNSISFLFFATKSHLRPPLMHGGCPCVRIWNGWAWVHVSI